IALMRMAQAIALLDGFSSVRPKQIQELAVPVLAHRLVMDPQAKFSGRTAEAVVVEIIRTLAVPV
ncbi:MAG: magnesium chelatase, partial [Thermosynechococcaceae cyanobacterium]